ncbi:MAG: hypothetical protein ACTHJ0_08085 [Flavipsychrobacter sp.]
MNDIQIPASQQPVSTQPKWLRVIATIFSYILHPVFMPVLMSFVIYKLSPMSFAGLSPMEVGKWLITIAMITTFYPLLTIALCKGLGFISSIHMYDKKDRIIPLIGVMIFYFWIYWVFRNNPLPIEWKSLMLGNFWGIILLFNINIFYKISMHTTAAGGLLGILLVMMMHSQVNMMIPLFLGLVVAGLIGSIRMILGAHKGGQIWLGYAVGIIAQVGAYIYLMK